jgi:hypothetical protein
MNRILFRIRLLAGALLPHAARAAPAWRMLSAPRFTVVSQLADKDTLAWAGEFSQFIEALRGVAGIDPARLPPLTVVLFSSPDGFAPYRPLAADGKPIEATGFFVLRNGWAAIGLAHRSNDDWTRAIIFHEGVHWCLSATASAYPLWLNEGLAEVFSTFRVESGHARWGDPIPAHLALLREKGLLPIGKFLGIAAGDPLYFQKHRIGIYYAEAWVFVHYLLFGRRAGARLDLSYFLGLKDSGLPPEKAFEQAFGTDYSGMDEYLARYVESGSYAVAIQRLSPSALIAADCVPAPPDVVQAALGRLAAASDQGPLRRVIR